MTLSRPPLLKRRRLLAAAGGALALAVFPAFGRAWAQTDAPEALTVFKDPFCGCCSHWIERIEAMGIVVAAHDLDDLAAIKAARGVPDELHSCHTADLGAYVIEGHVPPQAIARLVAERPAVAGLAVAGMPLGSPGMEGPDPAAYRPYEVVAFGPGGTQVFMRFRGAEAL